MSEKSTLAMLMTEDELEARMDAFFVREFGKTYKADTQPATAKEPDSLQKILADYPLLFSEGPSGTA